MTQTASPSSSAPASVLLDGDQLTLVLAFLLTIVLLLSAVLFSQLRRS